jgi:hypothetical protein
MSFLSDDLDTVTKLFLAGLAVVSLGGQSRLKLRVSSDKLPALQDAISAARRFHDTVTRQDVTVQEIMDALNAKNDAAAHFKSVFGYDWPA